MAARSFILFPGDRRWRIAATDGARRIDWIDLSLETGAPDDVAEQVAGAMRRTGYRGGSGGGGGAMLAIPSSWCISASISNADLRTRRDRRAMLFRLEEKLPLAAEEVVADFIESSQTSLGVCARVETLKEITDALESRGVAIESIAPAAMLAAQDRAAQADPHVLLIGNGDSIDVMGFEHGRPIGWSVAPASPSGVKLHIEMQRRRITAEATRCWNVERALLEADEQVINGAAPDSAAAQVGHQVLVGRVRPWIELRRDALAARDRFRAHRRALNAALAAAAVLLLCVAGASVLRAARYDAMIRTDERALSDLFRAEFPGWNIPVNVRAVIESEHRRLAAQQVGAAQQASAQSALRTLIGVLGSLPPQTRVSVARLSFDDRTFSIEGRVPAPAELDAIAEAVRSAGFRVAPPQAQRDGPDGAWSFTLRGEVPAAAPGSPASSQRVAAGVR
jgi:type II secretion system protein L